ncbi:hypothetical protein JCM10450v2_000010 [Rhodotorula kratochvilovae]
MALPETLAQLKYVIFSWQNTPLLKRDGLARAFFKSRATMTTIASSLGGFPLTLWEACLPGSVPELWLSDTHCARLIAQLAETMGPSRAQASWKATAYHRRATLERAGPVVPHVFRSQAELEHRFGELKDVDDWHSTSAHWKELRHAQEAYAFLHAAVRRGDVQEPEWIAVDIETWEQDHDIITEVGVASLRIDRRGELHSSCEHYVLEENASKRNGRYCPDARDYFQLGTSVTLPRAELTRLLQARLHGRAGPVFLLLHDCRGDVKSLTALDVDINAFEKNPLLPNPAASAAAAQAYTAHAGSGFLLDTQRLYSGWSRRKRQVRLADACHALGVRLPGKDVDEKLAFHNSGNDAYATLEVFRRLLEQQIGDSADQVKPAGWTPGGRPPVAR